MPILTTDLFLYYSVPTATAGFTTVSSSAASNGGWISTTPWVDAVLDNLFPDVTGDENAAQNVDYKCLFLANNHATLTLQRPIVWLFSEIAGGANTAVAADGRGSVPKNSSAQQATIIASKNAVPIGISAFTLATTKATGLQIGDIPPLNCVAFWIRRTATNSVAQVNDGVSVRIEGDTSQ